MLSRLVLGRLLLGLVVFATIVLASAGSAGARQTENVAQGVAPTVELDLVGAVPTGPGVSVPIEVTIVSPRAARGSLQVQVTGQRAPTTLTVPIDVPANTPVRLPLSVPSSYDGINLIATVTLDGLAEVNETFRQWGGESTTTVGLIGVDPSGESVGIGIGGGTAAVRELDDASIRSAGLSQVSTLVLSPGGLRGLTAQTQALVLGWLGNGGEATIVGPPGSIDDVLPPEWRDGVRPGVGRVQYVDADWSSSLVPSASAPGSTNRGSLEIVLGEAAFDLNINGIAELAADAGLGLLGARALVVFLGIYALVAGPIVYLVLKRLGRLNLAWTALPALALIFTVAAVAVGSGIRGDRNDSHATIVEVQPTGSTARSALLLTSSLRGARGIDLPSGWNMIAAGDLGGNGSSAPISLRPDRDRIEVTMELDAGGAGVATFEGGAPMFDNALRISDVVADADGLVTGQATNGTDVTLTDAVAFAGGGVASIGTIEPGQTVDISVSFDSPFGSARRVDQTEFAFWPAPRWGERPDEDTSVGASNWGQWRALEGYNAFAPGTVGVVAWSDAFDSPAASVGSGRTGLVARAAIPTTQPGRSGAAIGHSIVSAPDNSLVDNANFFGMHFVSRVDVPDADRDYIATVSRSVSGLEVWVDEWRWIRLDGDGEAEVLLPAEAFVGGTAWVRTAVPEWTWPPSPGLAISPIESIGAEGERPTKSVLGMGDIEYRNIDGGFGEPFGRGPFPLPEPTPIVGDVREIEEFVTVSIEPGESESFLGELIGAEIDTYLIELEAGDVIGVRLRSQEHDSFLVIRDESGNRLVENDDGHDGGDGLHSELVFEASQTAAYLIDASELGQNGRGAYELLVERAS